MILDNVLGNFTSGFQLSLMKTLHLFICFNNSAELSLSYEQLSTVYAFLKFQTSSYLGSERLGTGL